MKNYLMIDIGGTFIKSSVINEKANILIAEKEVTQKLPNGFLTQLIELVERQKKRYLIEGIGLSIGGFINPEIGINNDLSVGTNFRTYNLKEKLKECTGYRVAIENDANCVALGELWKGGARGLSEVCIVTIGTGIGGAIVHGGKLVHGKHFKAGEFGMMNIRSYERKNGIIRYGKPFSIIGLEKRISEILGKKVVGEEIFEYLDNDEARRAYKQWIDEIAVLIGNIGVCFDPQKIVVGGGISERAEFINELKQRIYYFQPQLEDDIEIEASRLKNDAGQIGALYHWLWEFQRKDLEVDLL